MVTWTNRVVFQKSRHENGPLMFPDPVAAGLTAQTLRVGGLYRFEPGFAYRAFVYTFEYARSYRFARILAR